MNFFRDRLTFRSARAFPIPMFRLQIGGWKQLALLGSLLATVAFFGFSPNPPQSPKRLALLVGISEYEALDPLQGPLNDVYLMQHLLRTRFQFADRDILTLENEEATKAGILDAFGSHLFDQVGPEDVCLVYFSGHGSQVNDWDGDEWDGKDETLVAWDSRKPGKYDITDDEVNSVLRRLSAQAGHVLFVFDACNSGSVLRSQGTKSAPFDDRSAPHPHHHLLDQRTQDASHEMSDQSDEYVFIAATSSQQYAYEYKHPQGVNGALTYFLVRELKRRKSSSTYRDVMDQVSSAVEAHFPKQSPQLEGGLADHVLLNDTLLIPEAHLLVTPLRAGAYQMDGGQILGITAGSEFEVYPPGAKRFEPGVESLGSLKIQSVGPFRSEARLLRGGPFPSGARAVERKHHFSSHALQIRFSGSWTESSSKNLREKLLLPRHIVEAKGHEKAHLDIQSDGKSLRVRLDDDPDQVLCEFPMGQDKLGMEVEKLLGFWSCWFNVLSIDNPHPGLEIDFQIQRKRDRSGNLVQALPRISKSEDSFLEGESFELKVQNKSDQEVFLFVLDMDTKGAISLVFPEDKGSKEVLGPGKSWTKEVETFLDPGLSHTRDVVLVFATSSPQVDLSFLEMEANGKSYRGSRSQTPFSQVLDQIASPNGSSLQSGLELGNWVVRRRVVRVVR